MTELNNICIRKNVKYTQDYNCTNIILNKKLILSTFNFAFELILKLVRSNSSLVLNKLNETCLMIYLRYI